MVWTSLHARLHQTLRQQELLPPQSHILMAVSGGQDSLCLAKLLVDLQPKWSWQLAIAHCDHAWATDAGIATHVQAIATHLQLPFYLKTAAAAIPETEAAARQWRYTVLRELALDLDYPCIVTGHTLSDRAETLLYNLCRGAGSDGLSALTWKRQLHPQITLIRPLLGVKRSETGEFCQQFQLPVWVDVANQKLQFARNRLRQQVIPDLKAHINPQVEVKLAQTAELLKAEADYLDAQATGLLSQILSSDECILKRYPLRQVHLALQRRVIKLFMQKHLSRAPNFTQIEAVVGLINAPNRSQTSTFPGGKCFVVDSQFICCM